MTKWTAEKDAFSNGLIDTGITVFHVCDLTSEEETLRLLTDIADRHNIDVDALTAERDELKRRLDAVVASLKPDGPPIPGGMFDKEVRVLWRAGIELHTKALAIAEGRDNA